MRKGTIPPSQLERAKALSRLAWLQLRLGRPQDARGVALQAGRDPPSARRPVSRSACLPGRARAGSCATLASHLSEQKRWKEANQAREAAVDNYEKLVKRFPAEAGYRIALATDQAQLGLQYQFSGRVESKPRELGFDGLVSLGRLQT